MGDSPETAAEGPGGGNGEGGHGRGHGAEVTVPGRGITVAGGNGPGGAPGHRMALGVGGGKRRGPNRVLPPQGPRPEHRGDLVHRVPGGVPDAHHLYPYRDPPVTPPPRPGDPPGPPQTRVGALTAPPDLSEPVDVYSDWIDACEAANQ